MSEYKNKSVPEANSKTQVKRINVQKGRPAFYGLGWFKTSKPLSDGDYGYRDKKGFTPEIFKISGKYMWSLDDGEQFKTKDFMWGRGEWCRIKWPD